MHPPGWKGGSGVTSEKVASASVALFNSGAQSAAEIEESLKSSLGVNISMYSVIGNGTAAREQDRDVVPDIATVSSTWQDVSSAEMRSVEKQFPRKSRWMRTE